MAIRIISKIKNTFRVQLQIKDLFSCPTIAELSELINEKKRGVKLHSRQRSN